MGKRCLLCAAIAAVLVLGVVCLPWAGRWYLTQRLVPQAGVRLGRTITLGSADVGLRQVRLEQLEISGAKDLPRRPFLRLPELVIHFRPGALLRGKLVVDLVEVKRPQLQLVRYPDASSNFADLLRRQGLQASQGGSPRGRLASVQLQRLRVSGGRVVLEDQHGHLTLRADIASGELKPGGSASVQLMPVVIASPLVPSTVSFKQATVSLDPGSEQPLPTVLLQDGQVRLLPGLELTGIEGRLSPEAKEARIRVALQGSYGGAAAKLWSAEGWVAPVGRQASLQLKAARFSLGRVASILDQTPIIHPERALVDGQLQLSYAQGQLRFAGDLEVSGLTLFHPGLARVPVPGLAAAGVVQGLLDLQAQELVLQQLALSSQGLQAILSGRIARLGRQPLVALELEVPPVPCQRLVDGFPPALIPRLQGFEVKGTFAARLQTKVDYQDLDAVELKSELGIDRCQVVKVPEELSPEIFLGSFLHQVEVAPQDYLEFAVGPENPAFVPYAEISPHAVNVFLTTEDAGFFRHRGFIPSQFRAALSRNLKRGGFRLGASTISMQMVKNILLTHEKTISRKLQELFLTWYLERQLSKERILEIYLNAIEFGPGIYGIGNAAQHYFGKQAKELTPLEASFFATILPSPKRRYAHYCRGTLSPKWDSYVRRILRRMGQKGFVSAEELEAAAGQQIVFSRDLEALPADACLKRLEELLESWEQESQRRLHEVVQQAAPHQVKLHLTGQ